MKPMTRMQILQICNGNMNSPALPILHFILRFKHHEKILAWLIKHKKADDWIVAKMKFDHGNSPLEFVKWMVAQINGEREIKPLFYGKDYK